MNNPRPETPAVRPTPATTDIAPPATALDAAALAVSVPPVSASIEAVPPRSASPVSESIEAVPIEAEVPRNQLPKIIPFDGLARCGDEVWIENAGQIYRLRRTRQGKLILTK